MNLAMSMRQIAPLVQDEHLYTLEIKVREMLWIKLSTEVITIWELPADNCICNRCDSASDSLEKTSAVQQNEEDEKEALQSVTTSKQAPQV